LFESYKHKTDQRFWAYIIQQKFEIEKQIAPGGTIKTITKEALAKFEISLPNYDEQEKIGGFLKSIDNLITLHQRKLDKIKFTKKAYLNEMFPAEGESKPKRRFKGFTDDWEQCELSHICSMNARIGWQNLRTSEFLDSGDYYLITGTDFKDGRVDFNTCYYVKKYRYDQDQKIQIANGSILITKDGTLGKVAYVEGLGKPATLNAGVFNITTTSKNIDKQYLFQYLKAPFLMNYVDKKATGGTIKHLNKNILVDFPVIFPKIDEQKLIGNHLTKLDNLITLYQHKLDKLQSLKKSYLNEMFI
jgi:type I restriction enzyme S subunit